MTKEQKDWIDNASYEQLLRRWRFGGTEDKIFQGDSGDYYRDVMKNKRLNIGDGEHTRISKLIGWDK